MILRFIPILLILESGNLTIALCRKPATQNISRRKIKMTKMLNIGNIKYSLAKVLSSMLCAVLIISANTTSSTMIHQPKAPDELIRFKKIK